MRRCAAVEGESKRWIVVDKEIKTKGCAFLLRRTTKRQERPPRQTINITKRTMSFDKDCDIAMSEVSTNQSRDVSISSKPSRHDISLPTADQLPFKQVDNCPQVTTRVNKTFGSGSIRPEKRSISASRLDHHATESFPPKGEIGGMTTLKKCGFSTAKSLIILVVVYARDVHNTF